MRLLSVLTIAIGPALIALGLLPIKEHAKGVQGSALAVFAIGFVAASRGSLALVAVALVLALVTGLVVWVLGGRDTVARNSPQPHEHRSQTTERPDGPTVLIATYLRPDRPTAPPVTEPEEASVTDEVPFSPSADLKCDVSDDVTPGEDPVTDGPSPGDPDYDLLRPFTEAERADRARVRRKAREDAKAAGVPYVDPLAEVDKARREAKKRYTTHGRHKARAAANGVESVPYSDEELEEKLRDAGSRCTYCDTPVLWGEDLTWDHVVPLTKGGTDTLDNLVPACRPCNSSKGNRPLDEWIPEAPPEGVWGDVQSVIQSTITKGRRRAS